MKQAILAVDLGGNSRIALIALNGEILALWQRKSVYENDSNFPGTGKSFNVTQWGENILDAVRLLLEERRDAEVLAVTSSSQREGIVLIGRDGLPVAGYPNADKRGSEYVERFDWDAISRVTTLPRLPLYSAQKLYAMKKGFPQVFSRIKAVCSISDWVGYLFTGELGWERTQAVHSALYDIRQEKWSDELCALFDIPPEILAPLRQSGSLLGLITEKVAARTGLPKGTKFIVGGADTQIAAAYARAETGDIVVVNGTTTPIVTPVETIVPGPYWLSPRALAKGYLMEVNAGVTGANLDTICRQFGADAEKAEGFQRIDRAFASGELPACIAVFSQRMFSSGGPVKCGGFLMDNPLRALGWEDYAYAMSLNTAFLVKECVDLIGEHVRGSGRLIGAGGGFSGLMPAQAAANLTKRDVYIYEHSRQATLFGAFNICCQALRLAEVPLNVIEIYQPRQFDALDEYYDKWTRYLSALPPFSKRSC